MKPHFPFFVLLSFATLSWLATDAMAQGRNSSTSGGSGSGSSLFSGGGSSFGGSSFGSSGGPGAISRPTVGQGGIVSQSGAGQSGLGFGGQQGGQAGGGFIGRDATEVSQFFQNMNPLGNQAGGAAGFSRSAMNRGRDANSTEDVRPPIMVSVKIGFLPPARPTIQLAESAEQRLNRILQTRELGDASVRIEEGVAIITGDVGSPSERLVIERLARLEPGVDQVVYAPTAMPLLPAP